MENKALVGSALFVLIALTVPARPNDLEDARVFLTIQEGVKAEDLEVVARGLIRSCTLKPISELPRGVLQLCESFDDYKAARARWTQRSSGQRMSRVDQDRAAETPV